MTGAEAVRQVGECEARLAEAGALLARPVAGSWDGLNGQLAEAIRLLAGAGERIADESRPITFDEELSRELRRQAERCRAEAQRVEALFRQANAFYSGWISVRESGAGYDAHGDQRLNAGERPHVEVRA